MTMLAVVVSALVGIQASLPAPVSASIERDDAATKVKLNIPDLGQAAGAPPSGWCGEAAIQQALLFLGAWIPQKDINRAGMPLHPDLYSNEIPVALRSLQVRFRFSPRDRDLDGFIRWIEGEIDLGRPVLTGMKIYPTAHPEWALDHFTLVVGHQGAALVINTTWKDQRTVAARVLRSTTGALAFENASGRYYGASIVGPDVSEPWLPTRLFVARNDQRTLEVVVKCEGLEPGRAYQVLRSASFRGPSESIASFTATAAVHTLQTSIAREAPAAFRCVTAR